MISKNTILSLFNKRGTLLQWLKKVEKLLTEKPLLTVPDNTPQSTELVAVDNTGTQVMLKVGDGLTIANNVIKATGGGSGGGTQLYKHSITVNASEIENATLNIITTSNKPITFDDPNAAGFEGVISAYLESVSGGDTLYSNIYIVSAYLVNKLLITAYSYEVLDGNVSVYNEGFALNILSEDIVTPL